MGWVKDESGCTANNDGSVQTAADRYLLGGGENPVAVCKSPETFLGGDSGDVPLPARGSIHPIDTRMHLDAYEIETDGAVVSIVSKYSSDGRFRFPSSVPGTRWKCTFERMVFEIPFAQKVREYVGRGPSTPPNGQGPPIPGLPTYAYKWKYEKQRVLGKCQKVSISFPLKNADIDEAMEAIYAQQDNIQIINGRYWLFEGGDITDGPKANDYECNLNWYRETGVYITEGDEPLMRWPPAPTGASGDPGMASKLPGLIPRAGKHWAQPPFHRTVIIPPTSGKADDPPRFAAILQNDFDQGGYSLLAAIIPPFTP